MSQTHYLQEQHLLLLLLLIQEIPLVSLKKLLRNIKQHCVKKQIDVLIVLMFLNLFLTGSDRSSLSNSNTVYKT